MERHITLLWWWWSSTYDTEDEMLWWARHVSLPVTCTYKERSELGHRDTLKLSSGLIVVATQLWSLYSLWTDSGELIYKSEPNRTAKEFAFADMWNTWYPPTLLLCPFRELPHLCNRMERTFYKYKYTSVFQYPLKYWHVQQKWEQQK